MGSIIIDVTGRCNLFCSHCYATPYRSSHPKLSTLLETIELLPKGLEVVLMGGEPLVRNDILKIIKKCTSTGHVTILATNATLLTQDKIHALIDAGISKFQCSLDGPNPEVNDRLRGSGSFQRCIDGIMLLNESLKGDDSLSICMTVHRNNYQHVAATFEFVNQLGIYTEIVLEPTLAIGSGTINSDLIPSNEEWINACEQACKGWKQWHRLSKLTFLGLPRFINIFSRKYGINLIDSRYNCPVLTRQIYGRIFSDGRMYSCGRRDLLEKGSEAGLLPEEGQLAILALKNNNKPWAYPSSIHQMRKSLGTSNDPFCLSCPDRKNCSACPVVNFLGATPAPSLCLLAHKLFEDSISNITDPTSAQISNNLSKNTFSSSIYWKELRTQDIQIFVPGKKQFLQLSGDASTIWRMIVNHITFINIKKEYPVVKMGNGIEFEFETFQQILYEFGALQRPYYEETIN